MKSIVTAGAAAALLAASATVASAQIDPRCASAAEAAGLTTGYNIAFDAVNNRCVATPVGVPGVGLVGGLGTGGAVAAAAAVAVIVAIAATGDT